MTLLNEPVVRRSEEIVRDIVRATLSARKHEAVVGVAPAGAGKSFALGTAVGLARKEKLRVAVATPTNEQAFSLVRSLAERLGRETVTFVPASQVSLPEWADGYPNIQEKRAKETARDNLLVGTLNKLGDAFARGDLSAVDLLLIDEAYQAHSVHYSLVGDLAPRHLLMGDSGQLAPFSTAPHADRWRGLAEDPLRTAVQVLLDNHSGTKRFQLPITWRLDPRAIPVVRAFYPGHAFDAAVLPGVRELKLQPADGKRGHRSCDAALEFAASHGWAHVELPASAVVSADPETLGAIVKLVKRLFARGAKVRCEQRRSARALKQTEVAVAVSHNDQKNLLRLALSEAGFDEVVVDTANKLQGLTFEVVIAWHPLAGLLDADAFHLDPGRLCVMLTRHRQACVVVGRAGDRNLVLGIPPTPPTYLGWDANPLLEGWYVHETVFHELEPFRISWE